MLNLPLNFNEEKRVPDSYEEFYELINADAPYSSKFQYGFKSYCDKIVPITNGSNKYFKDNELEYEELNLDVIYRKIKQGGNFFVAISYYGNSHQYYLFRDNNSEDLEPSISVLNDKVLEEVDSIRKRLMNKIFGNRIDKQIADPYILKIILSYMQSFNGQISGITSIRNNNSCFDIIYRERIFEGTCLHHDEKKITIGKNEISTEEKESM